MDWNTRARELLSLGLSAKQILVLRQGDAQGQYESLSQNAAQVIIDKDTLGTSTKLVKSVRKLEPKVDIFVEPYNWTREQWWSSDVPAIEGEEPSVARSVPIFPLFHKESEILETIRNSYEFANILVIKLVWFDRGAIVIPLRPIEANEELKRDWAVGIQSVAKRASYYHAVAARFAHDAEWQANLTMVNSLQSQPLQEPTLNISLSEHVGGHALNFSDVQELQPIFVYSDDPNVRKYLQAESDTRFRFRDDPSKCDYWYTLKQLKFGTKGAIPDYLKGVNQFPFESALVRKDICLVQVARACRRAFVESCRWTLLAFDLDTELLEFSRLASNDARVWAVKPAQQARGAGFVVTRSLQAVVAAISAPGGDKVAQEYLQNPWLLRGKRKFDMRTIVMVNSFQPLLAWASLGTTYARVARSDFDPIDLTVKNAHLTVSRYDHPESKSEESLDFGAEGKRNEGNDLSPILCRKDLLNEFTSEERKRWLDKVEQLSLEMMKQIMLAGGHFVGRDRLPSRGACYGIDWIVDVMGQPKLIEVNFCPDLTVPCLLDPRFVSTILEGISAIATPANDSGWIRL